MLFAALLQLSCHRALSPAEQFARIQTLFLRGELAASEQFAANAAEHLQDVNPEWADRFRLLEAESAEWGGRFQEAIAALPESILPRLQQPGGSAGAVQALSILGLAHVHMHRYKEAEGEFERAEGLCSAADSAACGELLRDRGVFAMERGEYGESTRLFEASLRSARKFGQRWDESVALMNLGSASLAEERFDEARDWLGSADRIAAEMDARDVLVNVRGNLGWAMYKLGDREDALKTFEEAAAGAKQLGDADAALTWLTTAGVAYRDAGQLSRASEAFREALQLSKQSGSSEGEINSLVSLLQVSIDAGQMREAKRYLELAGPLAAKSGNREDALFLEFARAKIAVSQRDDQEAARLLREIDGDSATPLSMRFGAEHELAKLKERQGDTEAARDMYGMALATFELARNELNKDESKLPFLANASSIYDDYIHFLIGQGGVDEALLAADQSRAKTLAQGLGVASSARAAALKPEAVARKAGSTLLFYWLGAKRSYLWAVTPEKTSLFALPNEAEIAARIERYRKALLGVDDPLDANNADGRALYRMLVAPAEGLLQAKTPVMILADGALSQLNFETLIAPGTKTNPAPHYWIEDATLMAAPSLSTLASAKPARGDGRRLMLLGDAVSPSPEYPDLRWAPKEMSRIEAHFERADETVFARQQATPEAYLASQPQRFAYIHFVSHGFASNTDPLDSAIILSRPNGDGDSFKLYAREIMQHPIDARLVTISACNASGTRSYVGEGLVGLSWAFLRAGAHNAIGALWEVPDESTPRLMDELYGGLQAGEPVAEALRRAKLGLLHSHSRYREPFYWAPFQLYSRL